MTFPLIEAILTSPVPPSTHGRIGICTNSMAPGAVLNEIPLDKRSQIAALGSLVVNRDGAERLIVNALAHPSMDLLILFGEETLSFRPSSNLLNAVMYGYETGKPGNAISNGKGIAAQYPSISPSLLDKFKEKVRIIPLFWGPGSEEVVQKYLDWEKNPLPGEIRSWLKEVYAGKKIYYDSLLLALEKSQHISICSGSTITLSIQDFQHLQPPIEIIEKKVEKTRVPFQTGVENKQIALKLDIGSQQWVLHGNDSFLIAYTLNQKLNDEKILSPLEQLLLGVELSRAEMELKTGKKIPSFVDSEVAEGERVEIPLASRTTLQADARFYYKIGLKEGVIQIQSMAHDTCDSVFEWRSHELLPLIQRIAEENRFQEYAQSALHRMDVGIETGRAAIALHENQQFLQDFRVIFTPNLEKCPFIIAEGDSFLNVHQQIITKLYTEGVHMPHPDSHKGTMRSGAILAVFRETNKSLERFPSVYASGGLSTEEMRKQYAAELCSSEAKGAYTYGHRTLTHFGHNQIDAAAEALKRNPQYPFVVQRFDFLNDMGLHESVIEDGKGPTRTRLEATHDPCLTQDVYFIQNGKLHAFHIARAHNIINAYPENIFGLHDAYDVPLAQKLGIPVGDMFVLSNRGNILLLTEEQKTKRLISEPVKSAENASDETGPFRIETVFPPKGVGWKVLPLEKRGIQPTHPDLALLENSEGENLVEKATKYLQKRGATHNNPILGTWNPRTGTKGRLVFFQCNQQGKTLHATGVFLEKSSKGMAEDVELCQYLATQFSHKLNIALGELLYVSIPCGE